MDYIYVFAGLLCLFYGGNWLVKGAIALSAKLGLPAFLISLTVVGFGTSMPELLVSVQAALEGLPGIALGNVVGSNIANILLIIGFSSLIAPIQPTNNNQKRDIIVMFGATVFLVAAILVGSINIYFGLAMISGLAIYLTTAYFQDRALGAEEIDPSILAIKPIMIAVFLVVGLMLLAGGASLLVNGATNIATELGVSNAVIGLTVVAIGTSLPELATSIAAALKKRSDIAIGNVVGSNIFNILGILGITAVLTPIPVEARFIAVDGWVLLGVTALLCVILLLNNGISRPAGIILLVFYSGYIITMV